MRGKATGAHRPLPREKILYQISSYFSPIHQNIKMWSFCPDVPKDSTDSKSHNQSRIVSGESASKRLKNRVKSVVAVFRHLVNSARSYMTFLPHNVPQSIILIRLDVTSSFRTMIGKYKRIQRDKFPFVSRGNEDWKRRQRKLTKERQRQ